MAKIVTDNKKGFSAIRVNIPEVFSWGGLGVCDMCNKQVKSGNNMYYIPVLNYCTCYKCYNEWTERAIVYPEDKIYEERNFKRMKELLEL